MRARWNPTTDVYEHCCGGRPRVAVPAWCFGPSGAPTPLSRPAPRRRPDPGALGRSSWTSQWCAGAGAVGSAAQIRTRETRSVGGSDRYSYGVTKTASRLYGPSERKKVYRGWLKCLEWGWGV